MDKNLIQRTVSGIVYIIVIFFCTTPYGAGLLGKISPEITPTFLFYGLMTFFMLVGAWECTRIMKFGTGWEKWAVLPLVILVHYKFFTLRYFNHGFYFNFNLSEILAFCLLIIAIITLFRFKDELYYDSGKLIFTVTYTTLPFGFALGLPWDESQQFSVAVFMLFVLIWSSDTFAYISGRLFGKHKMAPKISPKKTWEGFAGGVVLTLIMSFFIEKNFSELRGNWIIIGFLVSVFAPLGDLVESQLKRSFGVKDSGNIIPGHGGVLDRLDSFIICAPVVYLYFILEKLF